MNNYLFIIVSTIEYVGVIVAMLALFRYPVSHYWPQIIFTALICSVLSHALSVEYHVAFAPLIQTLALSICLWLMFSTPLLWSLIMCAVSISVYATIQGAVLWIAISLHLISSSINNTGLTMYMIQLCCAILCLLLGYYLIKYRIGFLFIPTSREIQFVWSQTGYFLFIGSVVSFLTMGITYGLYTKTHFEWFLVLLAILIFVSVGLLYMMKRKNQEYVEKPWTR